MVNLAEATRLLGPVYFYLFCKLQKVHLQPFTYELAKRRRGARLAPPPHTHALASGRRGARSAFRFEWGDFTSAPVSLNPPRSHSPVNASP